MAEKILKLKGKTLVIIDWANVYGWFEKLKWEIDPKKLYDYLKSYREIFDIRLYFGLDKENSQSAKLHRKFKKIGYNLQWKEVKWVPVNLKFAFYKNDKGEIRKFYNTKQEGKFRQELKTFKEYIKALKIYRRKCDFDCEITLDVMDNLNKFESLILFSGDGDFSILVKKIIKIKKQAIVVTLKGAMGREYTVIPKGLYICNINRLKKFIKK